MVVVVAMSEWSDILLVALSKHHQTGVEVVSTITSLVTFELDHTKLNKTGNCPLHGAGVSKVHSTV